MSFHYQVTLNQGRTDTVTIESDSLIDVKTFFTTVSTANITSIKKIVYSKSLGIGSASTSYTSNNQNKFLKAFVKTDSGKASIIVISFPLKNLTKELIIKSIKKNLLCNGEKISSVVNIIVAK